MSLEQTVLRNIRSGTSRAMLAFRCCWRIENGSDALVWKSHRPRIDEYYLDYLPPQQLATGLTAEQSERLPGDQVKREAPQLKD